MAQMAHLWSDQKCKMKNTPYSCLWFTIHVFGITRFYKKNNMENMFTVWKMFWSLFLAFLHWFNFTNWIQPDLYLVHWRSKFFQSFQVLQKPLISAPINAMNFSLFIVMIFHCEDFFLRWIHCLLASILSTWWCDSPIQPTVLFFHY